LTALHFVAGEHVCYAFVGYMEGALNSGRALAHRLARKDGLLKKQSSRKTLTQELDHEPPLRPPCRSTDLVLLAAIHEEPESDELRLVLADWLEEHGDPRADLIASRCELVRLPMDCSRFAN